MREVVEQAIDVGFRHFDTAWLYNTEEGVGQGVQAKIKEGVIKREDVFITTKVVFRIIKRLLSDYKKMSFLLNH